MTESTTVRLRFDEGSHEEAAVTELAPGRLRLEETPFAPTEPLYAGDVIEVERLLDRTHRFLRVAERSAMRHYSCVVPRSFVESADYRAFGQAVEAAGGSWEGVFGGILHVHVPPGSAFDPEAELDRYLSSDWPEA